MLMHLITVHAPASGKMQEGSLLARHNSNR